MFRGYLLKAFFYWNTELKNKNLKKEKYMSEEIINVLDALAEKFGLAVDWTSANVIPYLEQLCGKYVNYEIATSVVWLVFGIMCIIFGTVLFKKMKYCYNKSEEMDEDNGYTYGCILSAIGFGALVIIGSIVSMTQIFDIVTCFTFPEKIIIEELKSIYFRMNN